jgi:hypothetical protein
VQVVEGGRRSDARGSHTSSKWKTRSSSQTFSNARSNDSTKTCDPQQMSTRSAIGDRTHLDEVQHAELALSRVDDEDEVQRRIVAVHDAQRAVRAPLGGPKLGRELGRVEEVACARGAARDEREDAADERLRCARARAVQRRVELGQAGDARGVDCVAGSARGLGRGDAQGGTEQMKTAWIMGESCAQVWRRGVNTNPHSTSSLARSTIAEQDVHTIYNYITKLEEGVLP